MENKIKIKAFHNNKMIFVAPVPLTSQYGYLASLDLEKQTAEFNLLPENTPIMRCLEIEDKNGKALYEGDIVKFHKFYEKVCSNGGVEEGELEGYAVAGYCPYLGAVLEFKEQEEDEDGFSGGILNIYDVYECGWHEESLEIVGNKYENPELLERVNNSPNLSVCLD